MRWRKITGSGTVDQVAAPLGISMVEALDANADDLPALIDQAAEQRDIAESESCFGKTCKVLV